MKTNKIFTLVVMAFAINTQTGCGLLEEKLASVSENQTVPSSIADVFTNASQAQQSYAFNLKPAKPKKSFFIQKAHADAFGCSVTPPSGCPQIEPPEYGHNIELNDCSPAENITLSADIFVRYKNSLCALIDNGDYISARMDANITGYDTFKISLTGLYTLTRTGAHTFSYKTTDSNRVGSILKTSLEAFNISVNTGDNLILDNSGGNTQITAGTVILDHNILDYKVTLAPLNLAWSDSSCSCPRSGSISGEAVKNGGASLGTMSLDFAAGSACGKANFTFRGKTEEVTLDTCHLN